MDVVQRQGVQDAVLWPPLPGGAEPRNLGVQAPVGVQCTWRPASLLLNSEHEVGTHASQTVQWTSRELRHAFRS